MPFKCDHKELRQGEGAIDHWVSFGNWSLGRKITSQMVEKSVTTHVKDKRIDEKHEHNTGLRECQAGYQTNRFLLAGGWDL